MLIKLNILAITTTDVTAHSIEAALAGVEGMELHSALFDRARLRAGFDAKGETDVVLIEVHGDAAEDLLAAEDFVASLPEGVVAIALGDSADPTLLRRLMRAGVKDMLGLPLLRQDLLNALTVLLSAKREQAMARGESVTSVCVFLNAKGGSGATTLAVNTACSLAARHKARVALIDLDLQFGDGALSLDLRPQHNVGDALAQADRIDGVLLKALMTTHGGGVDVLAAPASLDASIAIDAKSIKRIIDTATIEYDVVIIDLPRVVSGWTMEVLRSATTVFLVLQNNLATIRDARMLVDYLPRMGLDPQHVELVNNRAMAKAPSVSIEQLKETLKHERMHRVRNDFATALAAEDQGIPVSKVDAHSELAQDIDHLADYIWATHGSEAPVQEGFLKKFFGHLGKHDDKKA